MQPAQCTDAARRGAGLLSTQSGGEELSVGQWLVPTGYLLWGSVHGVMQTVDVMLQSLKSRGRGKMVAEKVSSIFKSPLVNERGR